VASSTFRVGPWALGVRSTRVEFDESLRRVLAAHVLDVGAPPNFSVVMADEQAESRRAQAFNFLYRSTQSVVRTRAPGRVLRALLQHLSDFVEPDGPTIRIAGTGLVVDGRAIVAPYALRSVMGTLQRRLNVAGMQVIDAPVLHLAPGTSDVLVPEPSLTVDTDALAEFEQRHPAKGREPDAVAPGRYPIMAWAVVTAEDQVGPLRTAHGVAAAAQQVLNADALGARETLEVIAGSVAEAPAHGVWWRDPPELVQQLSALAEGA
jgi:hypothetical protein